MLTLKTLQNTISIYLNTFVHLVAMKARYCEQVHCACDARTASVYLQACQKFDTEGIYNTRKVCQSNDPCDIIIQSNQIANTKTNISQHPH
jgi:hypothetical protein